MTRAKWCNARSQQAGLKQFITGRWFTAVYQSGNLALLYMNMAAGGYRLRRRRSGEGGAGGLSGNGFRGAHTIDETLANYYGDTADILR